MTQARRRLGRQGERRALRHLRRQGLKPIAQNWSCPGGELDLLAREGETLVVVEVRTSRARFAGGAVHTVGPEKRRRIELLTRRWLQRSSWQPQAVRFDVVAVERRSWWRWEIHWIRGAFEAEEA
jgi:putative endonuclease